MGGIAGTVFGVADNIPTYSYEYEEAVNAGFLVDYHTIECSTGFIREGIKYNDLSEEDKESRSLRRSYIRCGRSFCSFCISALRRSCGVLHCSLCSAYRMYARSKSLPCLHDPCVL